MPPYALTCGCGSTAPRAPTSAPSATISARPWAAWGCMAALRRTRAGRYGIEQAHTLEEILAAPDPTRLLLPTDSLFSDRPALTVNAAVERKLRNGAAVGTLNAVDGEYRVYAESGEFLLLGRVTKGQLNTVKSFFEL